MMFLTKQCVICKHGKMNVRSFPECKAFPEGIPNNILSGRFSHVKKHPDQDNDITFEERKD